MRYTPKTEKEVSDFPVLPPGTYDFDVQRAEDKTSKAGNEMIHLVLKVYHDEGTTLVHDYLMEKVAYKLRHFAYAVGIGGVYESGDMNAQDCLLRSGKVALRIKEDAEYGNKNEVKDYITPESYREDRDAADTAKIQQQVATAKAARPATVGATHAAVDPDDIPF